MILMDFWISASNILYMVPLLQFSTLRNMYDSISERDWDILSIASHVAVMSLYGWKTKWRCNASSGIQKDV